MSVKKYYICKSIFCMFVVIGNGNCYSISLLSRFCVNISVKKSIIHTNIYAFTFICYSNTFCDFDWAIVVDQQRKKNTTFVHSIHIQFQCDSDRVHIRSPHNANPFVSMLNTVCRHRHAIFNGRTNYNHWFTSFYPHTLISLPVVHFNCL